ncbi:histidine phosphatase family protein [Microbacteriaceae bacterium VKM Ac-2855]|nr:histidine phosphatase family protein [Microbacteriaceae bacterium VKM Ac-2855]
MDNRDAASRRGPSELILLRHGESIANVAATAAEVSGGHTIDVPVRDADIPLSPTGERQAEAVGRWISTDARLAPQQVWTSPYRRAAQTAQIALAAAGWDGTPLVDERLRDRDLGITDRLTSVGVRARYPEEAARREWHGKFYYRPPGGEAWTDLALRMRAFLDHLDATVAGGPVALFCHDAVVLIARYVCEGLSERELLDIGASTPIANASITRLVPSDEPGNRWRIERFNDTRHLEAAGAPVTRHDNRAPGEGDPHA